MFDVFTRTAQAPRPGQPRPPFLSPCPASALARLLAFSCLLALCACSSRPPSGAALAPAHEPTRRLWLDHEDRSTSPVVIKGLPARFALDTGVAMPFVLFEHALRRFGTVSLGTPEDGARPGTYMLVTTPPLPTSFYGHTDEIPFAVVKLPAWASPELDGIGDGLIGWPAISAYPRLFDTANLVFGQLAEIPDETRAWARFDLTDHGVLVIKTSSPENPLHLYIDTGSNSGVTLPPAQWQAWKQANPDAPLTLGMSYFGGQGLRVTEKSFARELKIGALTLRDVPVGEASPAEYMKEGLEPETVLSLGLAALDTFTLITDPDRKLAYALPNSGGPVPKHNRFGIAFHDADGQLLARVVPRTPAAAAGLQDGDRLVAVDRHDLTHWRDTPRALDVLDLSAPAGTVRTFVIEREGQRKTYAVTARDLLSSSAVRAPAERN